MLDLARVRTIIKLASPIMVGMLAVNLLTLVDTAMVGQLGNNALSAVGLGGFVAALAASPFQGIAAAVQAYTARRVGEGDLTGSNRVLSGGFLLGAALGLPLTAVAIFFAPDLYALLIDDPAVWAEGVPYFRLVMLSLVIQAFNFSFRGFWNGRHRPKVYMFALILMFVVNVVLNYIFIFGKFGAPALGTTGAAIGTLGALICGHTYYWILIIPHLKSEGSRLAFPRLTLLSALLKVGLPNGTQEFSMMACYTLFLKMLADLSTMELAAATVLVRINTLGYLPALGFGMAVASLVGRSLGEKDGKSASRWGWEVCLLTFGCLTLLAVPMIFLAEPVLAVFLTDPQTMATAKTPYAIMFLSMGVMGAGVVLSYALVGAGAAKRTMAANMFVQWFLFIPGVWLGIQYGFRLPGIFLIQSGAMFTIMLILGIIWRQGGWQRSIV